MQEISVSITTLFITLQALDTMKSVQVYKLDLLFKCFVHCFYIPMKFTYLENYSEEMVLRWCLNLTVTNE